MGSWRGSKMLRHLKEKAADGERGGAASRSGAPSGISFVASAHEIAINMDAMAKAGTFELIRDGSELQPEARKYRLARTGGRPARCV